MTDAALQAFVLFIRLNPDVPADAPLIRRTFNAYSAIGDQAPEPNEAALAFRPAGTAQP